MQEGGEDWETDSGSEEGSFLTVSPGGTEGNKEGWVWKESDMLRSWRRRWLSCKGGRLAYSRRPDEVTIANTSLISAAALTPAFLSCPFRAVRPAEARAKARTKTPFRSTDFDVGKLTSCFCRRAGMDLAEACARRAAEEAAQPAVLLPRDRRADGPASHARGHGARHTGSSCKPVLPTSLLACSLRSRAWAGRGDEIHHRRGHCS